MSDNASIRIRVINNDTKNPYGSMTVAKDTKLSQVKKLLKDKVNQITQEFYFLDLNKQNVLSEQTQIVSHILDKNEEQGSADSNNDIFIKLNKSLKPLQHSNKSIQNCIDDSKMAKIQIDLLLGELKSFSENRKKEGKQISKQSEILLTSLKKRLKDMKIEFRDTDQQIKKVQTCLQQKVKQSNEFIKKLQGMEQHTQFQMIKTAKKIGLSLFGDKKFQAYALDFNKMQYTNDLDNLGLSDQTYHYYQDKIIQKFQKHYEKTHLAAQANLIIVAPIGAAKGGLDAATLNDCQVMNKQITQTRKKAIFKYLSYIGRGIVIQKNKLVLNQKIIQQYEKLIKDYSNKNKDLQKIRKDCLTFLQNYGYEIEYGTYYFGSNYLSSSNFEFSKQFKNITIESQSSKILNGSLQGGGISEYGMGAFSGSIHVQGEQAGSNQNKKQQVTYTVKRSFKAHPGVADQAKWKQLVTQYKFWRVLGGETSKTKISTIMKNGFNMSKKSLEKFRQNEQFEKFELYLDLIYQHKDIMHVSRIQQHNINVILMGPQKSGRNQFGNQLIGSGVNNQVFFEKDQLNFNVQIGKLNHFTIINSSGLIEDNTETKDQIKKLGVQINKDSKYNEYKKIHCLMLSLKVNQKQIQKFQLSIKRIINIFGKDILRSTLLILNFQNQKEILTADKLIQKYLPKQKYQLLRKLNPQFDFQRQIHCTYQFPTNYRQLEQIQKNKISNDYLLHRENIKQKLKRLAVYKLQQKFEKLYNQFQYDLWKQQIRQQKIKPQWPIQNMWYRIRTYYQPTGYLTVRELYNFICVPCLVYNWQHSKKQLFRFKQLRQEHKYQIFSGFNDLSLNRASNSMVCSGNSPKQFVQAAISLRAYDSEWTFISAQDQTGNPNCFYIKLAQDEFVTIQKLFYNSEDFLNKSPPVDSPVVRKQPKQWTMRFIVEIVQ